MLLLQELFHWVFATWYNTVAAMFIFFQLLYWLSAVGAKLILQWMNKKQMVQPLGQHPLKNAQVRREILQSTQSIMIFSLQGIVIQQGIQNGWLKISYDVNAWCVLQVLMLFLWNEIHFYIVHRLLHTRWLIKRVHWVHHQSKEPTVFSTYSFHWVEAFLLGTVIFFPLFVFPFQLPALLSLPIISITLNTLGHCNYDFFPHTSMHRFFKFSNRHSEHHTRGRGNYGFLLPWFDRLFKTSIQNSNHE